MSERRLLVDEHVPGPVVRVLDSLGYDTIRAKEALSEGEPDRVLLEFGSKQDLTILTADFRFTIVDGVQVTDHAGVVYVDQAVLQTQPADVADGIDRIFAAVSLSDRRSNEFYLAHWME